MSEETKEAKVHEVELRPVAAAKEAGELDAASLQAILARKNQERAREFAKELDALKAKYRCDLMAQVVIRGAEVLTDVLIKPV